MDNIEISTIGTICFDGIASEQLIGKIGINNNIGQCKVEVYNNEGPVPHMHIHNSNNSFDCCVCLHTNSYFDRGNYTDTLSNKQCKDLDTWLRSISNRGDGTVSNWKMACYAWNMSTQYGYSIIKLKNQPDYSTMRLFRRTY